MTGPGFAEVGDRSLLPPYLPSVHPGAVRRRSAPSRRERRQAQAAELPALDLALHASGRGSAHHLLVVPASVSADDVATAAQSRFAAADWVTRPESGLGELHVTRHTSIVGPFAVPASLASMGDDGGAVYDVVTVRERTSTPPVVFPGMVDDLGTAFPGGLPKMEELRVVSWALEAARRLGGSVVFDLRNPSNASDAHGRLGVGIDGDEAGGLPDTRGHTTGVLGPVMAPDPARSPNLIVFTPVWLDPTETLQLAHAVDSRAFLATEAAAFDVENRPAETRSPETQAAALTTRAAAFDRAALAEPDTLTGYAVAIDAGELGWISIEVAGADVVPPLIARAPWAADGAVAYRVRWDGLDPTSSINPEAARLVAQLAETTWTRVGGLIADDQGFLQNPEDL